MKKDYCSCNPIGIPAYILGFSYMIFKWRRQFFASWLIVRNGLSSKFKMFKKNSLKYIFDKDKERERRETHCSLYFQNPFGCSVKSILFDISFTWNFYYFRVFCIFRKIAKIMLNYLTFVCRVKKEKTNSIL